MPFNLGLGLGIGSIPVAGVGEDMPSPVKENTVTLTAADLAVLDSVPFELVAAQTGKVLVVDRTFQWCPIAPDVSGQSVGGARVSWPSSSISLLDNADMFGNLFNDADVRKWSSTLGFEDYNGGGPQDLSEGVGQSLELVADSPSISGAIAASSLNDGGADFVNGDTFTVDGGLGTLATGTITNAVGGVVQPGGYTLNTTPNGYLVATGVATTATTGIGTGLLIDIDALDYSANPMTLTVKTLYSIMDV